jgi:hypothetical protein
MANEMGAGGRFVLSGMAVVGLLALVTTPISMIWQVRDWQFVVTRVHRVRKISSGRRWVWELEVVIGEPEASETHVLQRISNPAPLLRTSHIWALLPPDRHQNPGVVPVFIPDLGFSLVLHDNGWVTLQAGRGGSATRPRSTQIAGGLAQTAEDPRRWRGSFPLQHGRDPVWVRSDSH